VSEGTLSQDEIDALLGGSESTIPGETALSSEGFGLETGSLGGGSESSQESALRSFVEQHIQEMQQHFVSTVSDSFRLTLDSISRQGSLNTEKSVVVVAADMRGPLSGMHSYIIPELDTIRLISPLLGANLTEITDASLEALQENFEQLAKVLGAALSFQFGRVTTNRVQVTKMDANSALPSGDYYHVTYLFEFNGGSGIMYEVFDDSIVNAMGQGGETQSRGSSMAGAGMGLGGGTSQAQSGTPIQSVQLPQLQQIAGGGDAGNLGLLMDVSMEMTVELGRTRKLIREILSIGEGTIIELDKLAGEPVDILVNQKLIAKGEVVVIDENFGVRVTEIVTPIEQFQK